MSIKICARESRKNFLRTTLSVPGIEKRAHYQSLFVKIKHLFCNYLNSPSWYLNDLFNSFRPPLLLKHLHSIVNSACCSYWSGFRLGGSCRLRWEYRLWLQNLRWLMYFFSARLSYLEKRMVSALHQHPSLLVMEPFLKMVLIQQPCAIFVMRGKTWHSHRIKTQH